MTALLDTGFLYALLDRSDRQHTAVREVLSQLREPLLLPIPVTTEVAYLLLRELGPGTMADFIGSLATTEANLLTPKPADYSRAAAVVRQYADAPLDYVDALIVAIAERLDVTRILTLDRRHFHLVRPRHCPAFTLLP